MNYNISGAFKRHPISPQKSPVRNEQLAQRQPIASMLSTSELRRLVANMVD